MARPRGQAAGAAFLYCRPTRLTPAAVLEPLSGLAQSHREPRTNSGGPHPLFSVLRKRRPSWEAEEPWRLTGSTPLALLPEPLGFRQGIYLGVLPPGPLVAGVMQRSVVGAAERHDPLIAGFGAHGTRLGKA